ncbi:MAG: GyrI-like domain-containing protein [Salinibacterium amurskyense]
MNLEAQHWTTASIIYRRRIGAYGIDNQAEIAELKEWARTHGLLTPETSVFGITHDDPRVTPADSCRYDAAILTGPPSEQHASALKDDYVIGSLAGGSYAVAVIEHTAEGLSRGWAEIIPAVGQAGFTVDPSRPIVERYSAARLERDECELCVPIL